MNTIDVVIITKTPDIDLFRRCLKSIIDEVPVSKLILVDSSDDESLKSEIKKRWLTCEYIHKPEANRAVARQRGIEEVTSDHFAFIDDDVILDDDWFRNITYPFSDPDVGAVWGMAYPTGKMLRYYQAMAKIYGKTVTNIVKSNGMQRGLTHDTVIRTDLVKDIQIPPDLHVMEDDYIRQYIENKGKKWIASDTASCQHFKKYKVTKDAQLDTYFGYKLGTYSKSYFLKHLTLAPLKIIYIALTTRDIEIIGYETKKEIGFIKGIIKGILNV